MRNSRWSSSNPRATTARRVRNLSNPELNPVSELDYVGRYGYGVNDDYEQGRFDEGGNFGAGGGSNGGGANPAVVQAVTDLCRGNIENPDKVEWNGEDCDDISINIPPAEKVPHYQNLLDPEFLHGVYMTHVIGKEEACKRITRRERFWGVKSATAALMYPMLKDKRENTFHILTEASDLWKATKDLGLYGNKQAIFIGFNRGKQEGWFGGATIGDDKAISKQQLERIRAMFVPHGSSLQEQYAPDLFRSLRNIFDGEGDFNKWNAPPRNHASVNYDEMIASSKAYTQEFGDESEVPHLKKISDGGYIGRTFYETMQKIEESSLIRGKRDQQFVFFVGGNPNNLTGLVIKLAATAISITLSALTLGTVNIAPGQIENLINLVYSFAVTGKGNWEALALAAADIVVSILLSSTQKDAKGNETPLLGEATKQIVTEAYTVASIVIKTKDAKQGAIAVGQSLGRLIKGGAIKLPGKFEISGKSWEIIDVVANMAFEPIIREANLSRELVSSHLTGLLKANAEFKMISAQTIDAARKGLKQAEALYNGALDVLKDINKKGSSSLVEDINIRGILSTAVGAADLIRMPNVANLAAVVLNIPSFREGNAASPEAKMSFAGLAAGLGVSPSVFDSLQFDALAKAADESLRNKTPFTLPSTLGASRYDEYRIKIEKCFNIRISESKDRATSVPVPELPQETNPDALPDGTPETQQSLPPVGSTTDANGIVKSPTGKILGSITPQGFVPTRQTPVPTGAVSPTSGRTSVSTANFNKVGYFKRGLQIPPYIRVIGGKTFACLEKVTVKTTDDKGKEQPTDIRKCLPFLGDDIVNDTATVRMIADYCTTYLPNGKPRTRAITGGGMADALATDAAHPIGLQIACVAEAMLRENTSEAALRQLYDNLPNERMRSRSATNFGDEGYVHFEKYSRVSLPNGLTAPLEAGQRDYSAIFVWTAVEDAGRNCFQGWQSRNFNRNARILDAVGVPMSGMFTLNDVWKSLAEGGLKEGAIFVRLMPNGTPHTGVVVKRDGEFFETIEANALTNTGRGTDAAVQRFRMPVASAVDWKFFHVWDDSSVGSLRLPVGGRCCVVPETAQTGAALGRPTPTQVPPQGTAGGWIPTESEELRDNVLRSARAKVFAYHSPQVQNGANAAVYWKSVRVGISTSLVPKRLPDELKGSGYELNPDPFGEPLNNYVYKPEGVIRYAYRKRVYTAQDYQEDLKRRLKWRAEQAKSGKKPLQQGGVVQNTSRNARGNRVNTRFGLRDGMSEGENPMQNAIVCAAEKLLAERPSGNTIRSRYGGDFHFNQYEPLDRNAAIAATQEDYCAMFVWLVWSNAYNCLGGNISIASKPQKGQYCLYKNSRVKDSTGTTQVGQSLSQGSTCPRGNEPKVGAVFIANRQSGAGGHTGVVCKVNPNGSFETIEGNGTQKPVARYTYNSPAQANIITFLYPFEQGCAPQTIQARQGVYCCPPVQTSGCASCTGGGVKQPDGSCKCPPNTTPDPANKCNCKQNTVVTNAICAEAPPVQLDRDCRADREWVRAVQGEPRDAAFAYSPQGCWKCEKIRSTTETCNEPEPPQDPECAGIWIARTSTHRTDTVRFKYVGSCWYCNRKPTTVVRNPQCPPTAPPSLGTGWENVPAGDACNDPNYTYFKTSTGMCCFRKPKNPVVPPPKTTTLIPPPPTYIVPPDEPVESGSCRVCEENEDIIHEYERNYTDWDKKIIVPAYHHTKDNIWFAEIGGFEYPIYGDTLEIEEIETVTLPSVKRDVQNIQTMIARTETGEPNAVEGVKMLVTDLNKKVDALALQTAALDTSVLTTLVQDVAQVKNSVAKAQSFTPTDTKTIDAIVSQAVAKLQNFPATALETKVTALETGMQQALQTMQALPAQIKEAQATSASTAQATAQATAQTFAATAPPLVAEAVTEATKVAAANIPPNTSPAEAAKIVSTAAVNAAREVAASLPKNSPEAREVAEAVKTVTQSATPISANAIATAQSTVPQAVDVAAIQKDVADMKKILMDRSASECVADLVKKMGSVIVKLEQAAQTPEAASQVKVLQSLLAPVVVKMEEKHQELLNTFNSTAQATVKATANAASEAAQAAARFPVLVEDLKSTIASTNAATNATANATSAAQAQNMKLVQQLVEDAQARAQAGADVKALVPSLQQLQTAIAQGTSQAVEKGIQNLVANMQNVPVPLQALQQNYDHYNQQILTLSSHLQMLKQRIATASAQQNEKAKQRAMLNYLNMQSFYQQQCFTCPSCPSAVGQY
jgi:hypothetical protein